MRWIFPMIERLKFIFTSEGLLPSSRGRLAWVGKKTGGVKILRERVGAGRFRAQAHVLLCPKPDEADLTPRSARQS